METKKKVGGFRRVSYKGATYKEKYKEITGERQPVTVCVCYPVGRYLIGAVTLS